MKKKLILASASPRRREILTEMGLEFEIIPSRFEEDLETLDFTYEKIEELAYKKATAVLKNVVGQVCSTYSSQLTVYSSLILSADTVVVLDNKILGKPKDGKEAIIMLKSLSGKKHSVVTSICVIDAQTSQKKIHSETSYVVFEDLSEEMITNYVETFRPLDKAGSYGIQELPEGFIKEVEGSFENIIGLCSKAVRKLLNEFEL